MVSRVGLKMLSDAKRTKKTDTVLELDVFRTPYVILAVGVRKRREYCRHFNKFQIIFKYLIFFKDNICHDVLCLRAFQVEGGEEEGRGDAENIAF